jgi:cytochrome b561
MKYAIGYNRAQVLLHWLTVVLVGYNLLIDNGMRDVLRASANGQTPDSNTLLMANLHAWTGFVILAIMAIRLILRFSHGTPPPPADESRPLQLASTASHWLFYALLFALPISGALAYYGGVKEAGDLHEEILKSALWLVIAIHAVAALWHHFWKKDTVLMRMLRPE